MPRYDFREVDWDAPLDEEAAIRAIPPGAIVKGMFPLAVIEGARERHVALDLPRDRYLPFGDYPLEEHARVLVRGARALFPDIPLRQGLRRIGHGAVSALRSSTVGRVMWSTAFDAESALRVLAKAYGMSSPTAHAEVETFEPGRAVVRLEGIFWFLDTHHVGVMESSFRAYGHKPTVRVHLDSPSSGAFLCTW